MKTTAITLLAALATASVGFSGAARAFDYTSPAAPMNEIDVTTRPLPNLMPVAMSGTVLESQRNTLVLQRADGVVRATLPRGPIIDDKTGEISNLSDNFKLGDDVTVYGKLMKSGEAFRVKTEGIYASITPTKAKLFMLDDPALPSVAKYNIQPTARAALRNYRAHYTPL